MNDLVNMQDVVAPLTQEEKDLFYSLTTGRVETVITRLFTEMDEKIETMKKSFVDNINVIRTEVAELKQDKSSSSRSLELRLSNLDKTLSMMCATHGRGTIEIINEDSERWIRDMYAKAETVATKHSTLSGKVFGRVYETMRSKYGIDVDVEYSKFRKVRQGSKLIMCSVTPELRSKFEQALFSVASEKFKTMPQSVVAQRMPKGVKDACLSIKPDVVPTTTFRMICKEMEKRSGININDFINEQRPFVKYKKFSKSYFVYGSKKLRPIFNKTVEDMRRR